MKTGKVYAVTLVMLLSCFFLTGCMINVNEMSIGENGSGFCTFYAGYTEEAYNEIMEMAKEEGLESDEEQLPFKYNNSTYYGQVISFNFDNIKELNDTLSQYSQSVETGDMSFDINQQGQITFTLNTTENTGNTEQIEEQIMSEESEEELAKMLEDMIIAYDITFPSNIKQTTGVTTEAIAINERKLSIDFIKLANELNGKSEKFTFVSEINENYKLDQNNIMFNDVNENDWFYNQILKMVEKGLFKGKSEDLFYPNDTMTKAEFITVASRLIYDKPTLNLLKGNYNVWWDKYYNACLKMDIFAEDELSYESMTDGMQRQEMALVAFRIINHLEGFDYINNDIESATEIIPDFNLVDERFKESVAGCYSLGILCGTDDQGSFKPNDTITRAQASTVIYRIIDASARISK